jgi:hypothetical protein
MSVHAGPDGLRIRAVTPDIAVEYHRAGECPPDELALSVSVLDDCQGRRDDPVTLEAVDKKRIAASWQDKGIPLSVRYECERIKQPFPELPAAFTPIDSTFWQALKEAAKCVDSATSRYALGNIHLRSEGGLVTTTDGRQLFQHGGFAFPWSGDVMIPSPGVLGCAELEPFTSLEIGKTDKTLGLRIGNWTLLLTIDAASRYPKFDEILSHPESGGTILRLPAEDAAFLREALPRLPADELGECSVTLDLNGQACVRARGTEDSPITELVLSGAAVTGESLRVAMNRQYLLQALRLGLTEVRLSTAERGLLASSGPRRYLWMPLSTEGILTATADVIRIDSASAATEVSQSQPSLKSRRRSAMSESATTTTAAAESAAAPSSEPVAESKPAANGQPASGGATNNSEAATTGEVRRTRVRKATRQTVAGPIEQALALRDSLRDSVNKTNELIRSLKRHRQQSRLVATTLASLKQLQQAG